MAIAAAGLVLVLSSRPHLPFLSPLLRSIPKVRFGSAAAATGAADESDHRVKDNVGLAPKWKRLSSNDLGISNSMIDRPTRVVLNGLKRNGFEAYLVGGCVRDLILKRTPKDFDVITSAELKEVMSTFSRCEKIGKRFPICHVHIDDDIVEVSSFSTSVAKSDGDSTLSFGRSIECGEKDYIRWRNCLQRDFTINGLMFDPFSNSVYDYIGGMEDIRKAKCLLYFAARILRAVRIAARLGFGFARETAHTIKILASSILRLDKGRLLMEMNYMLAYGSAEASLRLLWRFGLLEILLPIQAAYLVRLGFKRHDKRVAILAFHKALSDEPRDPLVVAAFSLAVHNGGDICEALKIARMISKPHDISFHELRESQNLDSKALKNEVMHLAESVRSALCDMTDEYYVSQAMARYPKAPYSDLVFIPLVLYLRVCKIFECVKVGKEDGFVSKQGSKVDQDMLTLGSLQEVRH
ncbi:hypothetical protein RJ640_026716, partial [Escallonia rubra]